MGTFEQATLPVLDEKTFAAVHRSLEDAFSAQRVDDFLHRVKRSGLRARDFESVLNKGLLGKETGALYAAMGNSDQGQIRERYLWLVEQVAPELRAKYLKVYAYY
ncbi:hypothetical protein [Acidisarcina polymorpha]|nr:hypothetical protein [Acidisarcina polymorpha]